MTDTTDIAALKINTYSVNSNDAWPQCADDDRTGSYVKWEDVVKLLSAQRKDNESKSGFDSLKNLKFVADCCIENPDSIYASEFFLLLDEMFGKQGDYSIPVQAVAVSHLIGLLEAERQRADEYRDCIRVLADQLSVNALPKEVIEAVAALKAKLANPVVLPSRFKPEVSKVDVFKGSPVMKLDATGGWLNRTGVIIALNKAGFTVSGVAQTGDVSDKPV